MTGTNDLEENTAMETLPQWEPETPFTNYSMDQRAEEESQSSSFLDETPQSPFLSQFEILNRDESVESETGQVVEVMNFLYEEEFNDALFNLANEAGDILEESLIETQENMETQEVVIETFVRENYGPVIQEWESSINALESAFEGQDIDSMSEAQLESFMDQFAPSYPQNPVFEDFFKKLWKKAKKAVGSVAKKVKRGIKKGIRGIKRGIKAIGKLGLGLILKPIIRKLKRLIRPVLKRLLRTVINKLPSSLRPIAERLRKRFLGESYDSVVALEAVLEPEDSATADFAIIQQELDASIAQIITAESESEEDLVASQYEAEAEKPVENSLQRLEQERDRFIQNISTLEEGEDPTPHLERFIPAILPVLKVGIKLAGRRRVVNLIARLVARLIRRFVGRRAATPLSRALVDLGMRAVKLEAAPDLESGMAATALAQTVEETVLKLNFAPPFVFETDEGGEFLSGFVVKAFEEAAAATLPSRFLKQELRETMDGQGVWKPMPEGRTPAYEKYTHIPEVTISQQTAKAVKTFGGSTLDDFLQTRLGATYSPFRVRVHIYKAIPGTWLSKISKHEKDVPGLGNASPAAWSQLHPLTREAAGHILGQPLLGFDAHPQFLKKRHRIGMNQRFYYLEGVRAVTVDRTDPGTIAAGGSRASQASLTFNFSEANITLYMFLSEVVAEKIAQIMRPGGGPVSMVLPLLKEILDKFIEEAVSKGTSIKSIREANAPEEFAQGLIAVWSRLPSWLKSYILSKIAEWVLKAIGDFLKEKIQEFSRAQEDPADGVTLAITFLEVAPLRSLLGGQVPNPIEVINVFRPFPKWQIRIFPGFRVDE